MRYNELLSKLDALIPGAQVERDNDGQIIVYTGLEEGKAEEGQSRGEVELVTFELDDVDDDE